MRLAIVEKYRPKALADFIGMDAPRAILANFLADPYEATFLLVGPSGLGKTTMAFALAEQIGGEVRHVPARACNQDMVMHLAHICEYYPLNGKFRTIICDEADCMTKDAQNAFLSRLDMTQPFRDTVTFFTANSTAKLEARFQSRCKKLVFDPTGLLDPLTEYLRKIWFTEADPNLPPPDFAAIARASRLNVRDALNTLELELISPGYFEPPATPPDQLEYRPEQPSDWEHLSPRQKAAWTRKYGKLQIDVVGQMGETLVASTAASAGGPTVDAYEAADLLKVDRATIYVWATNGKLPQPNRDGRKMWWARADIEARMGV
jgi:predicted DNA-binding transcriptional regulator AlpA